MNTCALALAMLLALDGATLACPLARLVRIADEPLTSLRHKERPLSHRASTEGGKWDVYLRPDGMLHSIIRTDFGEIGQRKVRASFLTRHDFVLESTSVRYKSPLFVGKFEIESAVSSRYFFCKDVVYAPVKMNDESSGTQALAEAKDLKSIFESDDIASDLKRLK
jgi:hypothetical protein